MTQPRSQAVAQAAPLTPAMANTHTHTHTGEAATLEPVTIGIVSISDRASSGVYEDKGLPALQDWLTRALHNPITFDARLIPDEQATISATLIALVDAGCSLVLTTGGTGPALRDVTPEATQRLLLEIDEE